MSADDAGNVHRDGNHYPGVLPVLFILRSMVNEQTKQTY